MVAVKHRSQLLLVVGSVLLEWMDPAANVQQRQSPAGKDGSMMRAVRSIVVLPRRDLPRAIRYRAYFDGMLW